MQILEFGDENNRKIIFFTWISKSLSGMEQIY